MIYIALFRGINVGGKHIMKMEALKQLFEDLGFTRAKSYIQSGNVAFRSTLEPAEIKGLLSDGVRAKFGFSSEILIRSLPQIASVIEELPFSEEEIQKANTGDPAIEHLYAYFTDDPDAPQKLAGVLHDYSGPDLAKSGNGVVYVLTEGSIRLSNLAVTLGKTMGSATARNWKTVNKIHDLMKSLEQ